MFPKSVCFVLAILIIIDGVNMQGYEGASYLKKLPDKIRHAIDYLFLFLFAIIGYLIWKGYPLEWPKKLWAISYSTAIILVGISGLIDFISKINNPGIRILISSFRTFFTSPFVFGVLMLLIWLSKYKALPDKK